MFKIKKKKIHSCFNKTICFCRYHIVKLLCGVDEYCTYARINQNWEMSRWVRQMYLEDIYFLFLPITIPICLTRASLRT